MRQVPIVIHGPSSHRLAQLRAMDYEEFLQTDEWFETKGRALRNAEFMCEVCGARAKKLDVHHLTYERLGEEDEEDLQVLCRDCHEDRHAELDPERYASFRRTTERDWWKPTSKADAKAVLRALGMPKANAFPMRTIRESVPLDPEATNRFRRENGLIK